MKILSELDPELEVFTSFDGKGRDLDEVTDHRLARVNKYFEVKFTFKKPNAIILFS
jgi:hypothetical protein